MVAKKEREPVPPELRDWVDFLKSRESATGQKYAGLVINKSAQKEYRKIAGPTQADKKKAATAAKRAEAELRRQQEIRRKAELRKKREAKKRAKAVPADKQKSAVKAVNKFLKGKDKDKDKK